MVTPPTSTDHPTGGESQKRKASRELEAEVSASPCLESGKKLGKIMQRTPQATLTQSKLTGFTRRVEDAGKESVAATGTLARERGPPAQCAPPRLNVDPDDVEMEAPPAPIQSSSVGPQFITTDFLLKALKENTDQIVKLFTSNLGALSQRVEENTTKISQNTGDIQRHEGDINNNKSTLMQLTSRVQALEGSGPLTHTLTARADVSHEFVTARRSVRVWPNAQGGLQDLWGDVGDFLHDTMRIPANELGQEDIEVIERVRDEASHANVKDEVIVRFFDKRKRDVVFTYAKHLGSSFDAEGRPTAGLRLEIPPELDDTFRLLSRFGTRLPARHGDGTRRHIKFDDYGGSLYANVKLPGDTSWTRVTPAMAKEDLEASHREENTRHQKRLASKLVPGPRERLGRPMPVVAVTTNSEGIRIVGAPAPGKRPRWAGPPGRSGGSERDRPGGV